MAGNVFEAGKPWSRQLSTSLIGTQNTALEATSVPASRKRYQKQMAVSASIKHCRPFWAAAGPVKRTPGLPGALEFRTATAVRSCLHSGYNEASPPQGRPLRPLHAAGGESRSCSSHPTQASKGIAPAAESAEICYTLRVACTTVLLASSSSESIPSAHAVPTSCRQALP